MDCSFGYNYSSYASNINFKRRKKHFKRAKYLNVINVVNNTELKITTIILIVLICLGLVKKLFKNKRLTITLQNYFKILQRKKIMQIQNNKNKLKWENVDRLNLPLHNSKKFAQIINNFVFNSISSIFSMENYHKL